MSDVRSFRPGFHCLLLAAALLGAYSGGLTAPYTFDDGPALERNANLESPWKAWKQSPVRRLGYVSFALNHRLVEHRLLGYHVVNLAIHAAAAAALYGLVRRTLTLPGTAERLRDDAGAVALAVAAIWALHPLQTQSVTYLVQRFESLMGLFLFASLYALVRGASAERPWRWYLASLAAAWAGSECKEPIVVLPLVALLFDRAFLANSWHEAFARRGWLYAGLLLVSLRMAVATSSVAADPDTATAGFSARSSTPWEYLLSQSGVILHYLRLTVWPDSLCIDYRWPVAQSVRQIVPPGLLVVGLLGATLFMLFRKPRLGFLGAAFFLGLALTSSIVPIDDLAVEHRMYAPLAPLACLAVLGVRRSAESLIPDARARRIATAALLGATLLALGTRTFLRNRDYADPIRLWSKAVAVNPANDRAHDYLATALRDAGRLDDAERSYRTALALKPGNHRLLYKLGLLKVLQKQDDQAQPLFEQAIAARPDFALCMLKLADLHSRAGRFEQAVELYRRSVEIEPTAPATWKNLGLACHRLGRDAEAIDALRAALKLRPQDSAVAARLAWILATSAAATESHRTEALDIAERLARETARRDYGVLEVLGAAQAAQGRFEDARNTASSARDLAALTDDSTSLRRLERQIEAYRRGETAGASPLRPVRTEPTVD